jgi:Carboxylesterase family
MRSLILFFLVAETCVFARDLGLRAANWTVGQTVQTSSGPVSGHPATNDSDVSEYLGIPYGQAPVGNLRFAAPVAFNGTAALNGSSFVSLVKVQLMARLLTESVVGILLSCSIWLVFLAFCGRLGCSKRYFRRNSSFGRLEQYWCCLQRGLFVPECLDETTNGRCKEGCAGLDIWWRVQQWKFLDSRIQWGQHCRSRGCCCGLFQVGLPPADMFNF